MTSDITPEPAQRSPVIEIPPVRVAVSGIYNDGALEIVHGQLGAELTVQLPGGAGAEVRLATDGVVLVAAEEVMLVAFGVRPGPTPVSTEESGVGRLELMGRAEDALHLATEAMRWIEDSR